MSERITLLHCADLHFTYTNHGKVEFGQHSRLVELTQVWHHMIDVAISSQVDAALIAGDLFRTTKPEVSDLLALVAGLRRLGEAGIPTVIIDGNHDRKIVGEPAALDLVAAMRIPGVFCSSTPTITRVLTRGAGYLQVGCFPAFTRANLMAQEEYKSLSPSELAHMMAVRAGDVVYSLATEIDPGLPAVLLAHHAVSGAVLGSEQQLRLGGTNLVLPLDGFRLPVWQAVLLGDIHRAQVLAPGGDDGPWVGYCGSPYRIDFGEEKERKGCYIHTLERHVWGKWRHTEAEFMETPCRRFHTADADVSGWTRGELLAGWIDALKSSSRVTQDAIVRVKLAVSEDLARLGAGGHGGPDAGHGPAQVAGTAAGPGGAAAGN